MGEWKRFGDEKPPQNADLWVKTARSKKPRAMYFVDDGYGDPFWNGRLAVDCRPNDLWCYAEPPPLPGEER